AQRHAQRGLVRAFLRVVAQRRQRWDIAVVVPQALPDQVIGEPGILREHGTVQIGPVDLAIAGAFAPVPAIVPTARQHASYGLDARAQYSPPAVVLEPHECPWGAGKVALDGDVVHEADAR